MKVKLSLLILFKFTALLSLTACAASALRNPEPFRRVSGGSSSADFQDDQIGARISAAFAPQIGKMNVSAIAAIYDRGTLRFLSFGETRRGGGIAPTPD